MIAILLTATLLFRTALSAVFNSMICFPTLEPKVHSAHHSFVIHGRFKFGRTYQRYHTQKLAVQLFSVVLGCVIGLLGGSVWFAKTTIQRYHYVIDPPIRKRCCYPV